MGRQVNFYMTADDEREFVAFVRGTGNVAILKEWQDSEQPLNIENLPPQGTLGWFALCLWNKDISPAPTYELIQRQGYYSLQKIECEVIEFGRCGITDGRISRGRIWAETKLWPQDDAEEMAMKGAAFVKWYEKLARWLKRRSPRHHHGEYYLPGADAHFAERKRIYGMPYQRGSLP